MGERESLIYYPFKVMTLLKKRPDFNRIFEFFFIFNFSVMEGGEDPGIGGWKH